MILNEQGLKDKALWESKGYKLPAFDREKVTEATKAAPVWIHFGAGNIFRAFQAEIAQKLLEEGVMTSGLIAAEGFDYEIIEKSYRPHDNYSILVTLKANGSVEKTVVGSVTESCIVDSENEKEFNRLKEIFASPSLQMMTFTITEKGYSLRAADGSVPAGIAADFAAGPEKPGSYLGKVVSLLHHRYVNGATPIAVVSTDNCSQNGEKIKAAVLAFADEWTKNGVCAEGFAEYVRDGKKVSYPWSMIDKITPRPDASVEAMLREDGLEELDPVVTSKNTYVAPFVNAEESEYLVIEDDFPNGRPALEKAGVYFTDRETVDKVERMKVYTCLNPLHTALAVFGCLLGYTKISDEMKDADLKKLVEIIGYQEGMPVVVNPGIIDPKDFIDTVLQVRVPNPFMPDTPQRIACDTSQKLSIRFGETIKAYVASDSLNVADLKRIPLVFAGWLRYLMAIDDEGKAFELSPDPMIPTYAPYVADFKLGEEVAAADVKAKLLPVLTDAKLFGIDLVEAGLADTVVEYFCDLLKGAGAVRKTLQAVIAD